MADRVGQQFGNYRLTQLLGKGGFAEVYLGEHIMGQVVPIAGGEVCSKPPGEWNMFIRHKLSEDVPNTNEAATRERVAARLKACSMSTD